MNLIMQNYLDAFETGMALWRKNTELFINQINLFWEFQNLLNENVQRLFSMEPPLDLIKHSHSNIRELTHGAVNLTIKSMRKNWELLNDCINLLLDTE
jgi:hypothetical protein